MSTRGMTMMAMHLAKQYVDQYEAGAIGIESLHAHAAEFAQCEVVPQGASGKWYRFKDGAVDIRDDAPPYA